jgi:hypothetical protein
MAQSYSDALSPKAFSSWVSCGRVRSCFSITSKPSCRKLAGVAVGVLERLDVDVVGIADDEGDAFFRRRRLSLLPLIVAT